MRLVRRVECIMGWFGCPAVGVMKSWLCSQCISRGAGRFTPCRRNQSGAVLRYLCPRLAVKPETARGSLELLYACWLAEHIRGSGRWTSAEEWIQWIRANRTALKQLYANSVKTLFFLIFLNPCTLSIILFLTAETSPWTYSLSSLFLLDLFLQLTHIVANIYQRPDLVIDRLVQLKVLFFNYYYSVLFVFL